MVEKSIISITSPFHSCFLHSSNCITCQWKWNKWVDMAFTDSMNLVSSCARGPLHLILSMTHFFLVLFSPLSRSMYCHWCHITLLQSISGFCFIIDSCNVFIVPHFFQFLKIQSWLWSVITMLSPVFFSSNSNLLEIPLPVYAEWLWSFSPKGQKKFNTFSVFLLLIPLTFATISASTIKLLFTQ